MIATTKLIALVAFQWIFTKIYEYWA